MCVKSLSLTNCDIPSSKPKTQKYIAVLSSKHPSTFFSHTPTSAVVLTSPASPTVFGEKPGISGGLKFLPIVVFTCQPFAIRHCLLPAPPAWTIPRTTIMSIQNALSFLASFLNLLYYFLISIAVFLHGFFFFILLSYVYVEFCFIFFLISFYFFPFFIFLLPKFLLFSWPLSLFFYNRFLPIMLTLTFSFPTTFGYYWYFQFST